jgi:hypothetical protein
MTRIVLALLTAVLWLAALAGQSPADEAALKFSFSNGKDSRVDIRGWSQAELTSLRALNKAQKLPDELLRVYVAGEEQVVDKNAVPLFGSVAFNDGALVFLPRYPFLEGVGYQAVVRREALKGKAGEKTEPVAYHFAIPQPDRKPTTEVSAVYPSGDVLPENQLKFYLHFSAPMSRGNVYRHLHLLREDSSEVELPFLELGEELWDSSGRRLTVLFDPGRIKRGLKPREDVGPVLEEGHRYTFVIDRQWRDASGQPLVRAFRKRFQAAAPDDTQPDPKHWKIDSPPQSTRRPFTITFNEPLDHAMLHHVLSVRDPDGEVVDGKITVDRGETRWRFTPRSAWKGGDYSVLVATTLEDRAGNSIGRPFEVDIFNKVDKQIDTPTVVVSFTVNPSR